MNTRPSASSSHSWTQSTVFPGRSTDFEYQPDLHDSHLSRAEAAEAREAELVALLAESNSRVADLQSLLQEAETRELVAWRENAELRVQMRAQEVESEQLRAEKSEVGVLRAKLEDCEKKLAAAGKSELTTFPTGLGLVGPSRNPPLAPPPPTANSIRGSFSSNNSQPQQRLYGHAKKFVDQSPGRTRLHWASYTGNLSNLKVMVNDGDDINKQDSSGLSALAYASRAGYVENVRYLLERKAKWDLHTHLEKNTALSLACRGGHLEVVQLLVAAGAPLKSQDGLVLLIEAARFGKTEVVAWLLDQKVRIDERDSLGCSALHWASRRGHVGVVSVLLSRGANKEATALDGKTALKYAEAMGYEEIARLLR